MRTAISLTLFHADLKLVNDVVELTHDPKFAGRMF